MKPPPIVKVLMRKVSQKSCKRNSQVTGGVLVCSAVDVDEDSKEVWFLK